MTDCVNVEVRELLPELVHGTLGPRDRARVEAHVQRCADCAAELALLRDAYRALRPSVAVDVARIVRALPGAPAPACSTAARPPRVAIASRGWARAAAALLVVAGGGAGVAALQSGRERAPVAAQGVTAPPVRPSGRELLVASGIAELDDAELVGLLSEIEALSAADALPSAEPAAVVPPLLDEEGA